MNKELIERLALVAGFTDYAQVGEIERFAALVAEECAEIARRTYEGSCDGDSDGGSGYSYYGENSADAIREAFKLPPLGSPEDLRAR